MAKVGDQIELASKKIGQEARTGTVTGLSGSMLTVRWSSGHESMFIPGPGSLNVVGHARTKRATSRKAR
jgi:hypothetical protein